MLTQTILYIQHRGTKPYHQTQFWGGYTRHNQIYKIEKDGECILKERLLVQNHAIMMYDQFIKHSS